MAKELKGALSALLEDSAKPKKESKKESKMITAEIRSTFIVDTEKLEKIKDIAFHHNILIKDVLDSALEKYIAQYEKKHGQVPNRPTKKQLPI